MRKLAIILLALILALGTISYIFAIDSADITPTYDAQKAQKAAEDLHSYNLMEGTGEANNPNPDYALDRQLSRIDAVVMMIRLSGKEAEAQSCTSPHPFDDVPEWATNYINYAYKEKLVEGIGDNHFGSEKNALPCEFVTLLLKTLGYEEGKDFTWDHACSKADDLGILHGEYSDDLSEDNKFYRGDVAIISNETLTVKTNDGKKTLAEVATGKTVTQLQGKEEKVSTIDDYEIDWSTPSEPVITTATEPAQTKQTISFTIPYTGTYQVEEGTTWAEWILSYGISAGDNGIVWICYDGLGGNCDKSDVGRICVDWGNGLGVNQLRYKLEYVMFTDAIIETTYDVSGPTL